MLSPLGTVLLYGLPGCKTLQFLPNFGLDSSTLDYKWEP